MWDQLVMVCSVVGAVWLCRLVWQVLLSPLIDTLRPEELLDHLHTRAVLITGCDSGFGEALARRLDELGVPVFAGCLFPDGPGAKGLVRDCSSRLRVLPLDVTSDQQVADAVTAIRTVLSSKSDTELWALVNNAGLGMVGEIDLTPVDSFEKILQVNTIGAIRVTKAFLPLLKKSKGRVVNICSSLGRFPVRYCSPYAISKSALKMFSDILRIEAKMWSISVCTIEPGLYKTNITSVKSLTSQYAEILDVNSSSELDREVSIQKLEKLLLRINKLPWGEIPDMVNEMVAACVGRNKKDDRIPRLTDRIAFTLFRRLPESVRHFIWDSFLTVASKS